MPVLDPKYIGSWYHLSLSNYNGQNVPFLSESYAETHNQTISKKDLLQGDIGVHVMDIGGMKWETKLESPIIILNECGCDNTLMSLFEDSLNFLRGRYFKFQPGNNSFLSSDQILQSGDNYDVLTNVSYLMSSATLNFGKEAQSISLDYVADRPGICNINYSPVDGQGNFMEDFYGRTAKWYDTRIWFPFYEDIWGTPGTEAFFIESGSINVKPDISENYFINSGTQYPYFSVQGYTITGSLRCLVDVQQKQYTPNPVTTPRDGMINNTRYDAQGELLVQEQKPGCHLMGSGPVMFQVGNCNLINLGNGRATSKVSRSIKAGAVTMLDVDFTTYANYF